MSEAAEHSTPSIRVVLLPWLPALIGQDEHQRATLAIPYAPGDTVRSVLVRLGAAYPDLDREIWDQQRTGLGQIVEVVVNGAVLDLHHTLDSPLQPGDELLLVPQYQGG